MSLTAQHEIERHTEDLIAAACRLVKSGTGVRSVRVVTNGRPTYDALRCYHEWARQQHVRLSVNGDGVIKVRPGAAAEQ
jgi:hypothetical protein